MSILTFTFDTLKYSKRLQEAGLAPRIAEAEAEILSETLSTALNTAELVTKRDLAAGISEIKADNADQRTKIVQWLAALMIAQAAAIAALVKLI